MRTINKFFILVCLIVTTLTSTSCLKDDPLFDWDKMGFVIELPYKSNTPASKTAVTPANNVSFDFMVNYTLPYESDNKEDIPVGIAAAPEALDAYNKSLGASGTYILLPASAYTLPSPVIAKGKRLFQAPLEIKTSGLELNKKYVLPVKITSVPAGYTISGNYGIVYLRVHMAAK